MISGDPQSVADLSRFESGGAQLPGAYAVDIYVNGQSVASRTIRFIAVHDAVDNVPEDTSAASGASTPHDDGDIHDSTGLMACLNRKDLVDLGVNTAAFPALASQPDDQCVSPGKYIPQAYTAFDFQKMRLDVSIPQAALLNRPHGWIPPERWDEGVNAAMLSYQFSGSDNFGSYGNSRSLYLNLTSGVNLGAWRLRDNSIWSSYESRYGNQNRWQHLNTYVQRTIVPWHSELTLGDSTTGGDVFDALSFRGAQLATDDSMYPDTMRGFAPEIKGTAYSNAKVSVRQNGNVIYQTFVAPGAFAINDLYPMSAGGDLEVTVTEADGTTHVFTVPYSSVPVLQREGHIRYSFTAGRYRNSSDRYSSPMFAQGTVLWGLPHHITAYGGLQVAEKYWALALGVGLDMGRWGALSADITQASSTLADGSHHNGQSIRFLYSRSLVSTGTTFQLMGYRYSTQGFHTLDETALKGMSGWLYDTDTVDAAGRPLPQNWLNYYNLYSSKRGRLQVNVSQRIGRLGSLYLAGTHQTYWHNAATTNTLQAGFSGTLGHVGYSLSYGYSRVSGQPRPDQTLFLSLSLPLDKWLPHGDSAAHQHSVWANYNASRDTNGNISHQAALGGTALAEDNLSWSVAQGYGREDGNNGDVSLGYQGTYGKASVGYGYSRNYRQVRYGASGAAVLHGGGLTLGQSLGTTNVLVAAPGAAGVPVENGTGIHTDWRGYTVVPYASAYRENRVALDVSRLDDHTDIDNPVTRVVPTQGALVRADFTAHNGARTLITLTHQGKPLPFGTTVSTGDGNSSGLVADGGQVYLSGLAQDGNLKAQWGSAPDQQCTVHYQLPKTALQVPLFQTEEVCQ
ncbi:hypothetical protein WS62_29680 [Burkholderia sp. ABCPW 14]|nr:hypothetical protein WS62_29680 [Burkholderia sp. ABCPW 14]